MANSWNLFPIGSTGFDENNPLQSVTKEPADKNWWDFSLPEISFPSFDIPGTGTVKDVYSFFDKLSDATTWQRGGIILIGIIFLGVGLFLLGKDNIVRTIPIPIHA